MARRENLNNGHADTMGSDVCDVARISMMAGRRLLEELGGAERRFPAGHAVPAATSAIQPVHG